MFPGSPSTEKIPVSKGTSSASNNAMLRFVACPFLRSNMTCTLPVLRLLPFARRASSEGRLRSPRSELTGPRWRGRPAPVSLSGRQTKSPGHCVVVLGGYCRRSALPLINLAYLLAGDRLLYQVFVFGRSLQRRIGRASAIAKSPQDRPCFGLSCP